MGLFGYEEALHEAINCYMLAIKIYTEQKRFTLVAALYNEMAGVLKVSACCASLCAAACRKS
jgi:hypothetical protein